jgi:hypothetical protein
MDDISVTGYRRLPKLYSSLQVYHVAQIVFQCHMWRHRYEIDRDVRTQIICASGKDLATKIILLVKRGNTVIPRGTQ